MVRLSSRSACRRATTVMALFVFACVGSAREVLAQSEGYTDYNCSAQLLYGRYQHLDGTYDETFYMTGLELNGWVNRGTTSMGGLVVHYFSGQPNLNDVRHSFGLAETEEDAHAMAGEHTDYDMHWEHAYYELFELVRFCNFGIMMY